MHFQSSGACGAFNSKKKEKGIIVILFCLTFFNNQNCSAQETAAPKKL
jgi:hypothetical protein